MKLAALTRALRINELNFSDDLLFSTASAAERSVETRRDWIDMKVSNWIELSKHKDLPVENHSAKYNTVLCEPYESEILSLNSGTIGKKPSKLGEKLWKTHDKAVVRPSNEERSDEWWIFGRTRLCRWTFTRYSHVPLFFFFPWSHSGGGWETTQVILHPIWVVHGPLLWTKSLILY